MRRKGKGVANRIAKQLAAVGALPNSFQLAVKRSLHRTHRDTMRRVWGRYRYPGTGSTAQQTAEKTVKQVVCVLGLFLCYFLLYMPKTCQLWTSYKQSRTCPGRANKARCDVCVLVRECLWVMAKSVCLAHYKLDGQLLKITYHTRYSQLQNDMQSSAN